MMQKRYLSASIAALAAFAALACAKHPAASFEVVQAPPPHIESIVHGAPDGAHPGDTVSITMKGDPGMKASATLASLVPSVGLAEDPSEKGLYRGTVRVPEGSSPGSFDLTGRLEADAARFSSLAGPPLRVLKTAEIARREPTAADFNAQKVLGVIHFDFDKADLRDDARSVLAANSAWLMAHPSLTLVIEGHCDERGTNEYNLALGDRRANAAKDFLLKSGIAAERLRTISYGEERPLDPGHDEQAWAQNRRAEFVLED